MSEHPVKRTNVIVTGMVSTTNVNISLLNQNEIMSDQELWSEQEL